MSIRNLIAVVTIIGMALVCDVRAAVQTLPFTDHFTYSDGNLYSVAAGVWDAGGSAGAEFTVSTNAALASPTNFAVASGKGVKWQPSGTARRNIVQFSSQSSGEIYVSFLLNNVTAPSGSRLIAYLENVAGSTVSSPQLGIFLDGTTLGIGKKATSPAVTTTLSAGTHLIVVRYTFLAGNDQADLWVDPSSADYGATNAPASLGSTTGGSDPTTIQYFAFNGTSGSGPVVYYDEVRISTNWGDVTPSSGTPPPPPSTNGLAITQAYLDPSGFVIRGVGGNPTGMYEVITTTDISTTLSNWLSISTNQFDLAGNFDSTNPVSPLDLQRFYCLRIDTNAPPPPPPPPPGAPGIASQPQNLTTLEGQTAVFSVIATGSPPLYYQWYFNTNSTVANATNSTLTLNNVQLSDAGNYSVSVSNAAASVASDFATLTVTPSNAPNFDMIGFATLEGGTTGGSGGTTTTVSNATDLEAALNQSVPLVVQIQGSFSINNIDSKPNKTIIGLGANATISGTLKLTHTSNMIVRNITFDGADQDNITIQNSSHVWVDHCTFIDAGDGELDITHASEWVTVSWCKFYYTTDSGHNFVNLIGHDDDNAAEDTGHLHVTWHHNWWSTLCIERMPRVRFGQVHSFNNYFNASLNGNVTNSYCVRAAIGSQLFIENNFFENVHTPWKVYITPAGGPDGLILATNNNVGYLDTSYGVTWGTTTTNSDHTIDVMVPGTNVVFTPTYSYGLESASVVPGTVTNNAGAAKGPFAP